MIKILKLAFIISMVCINYSTVNSQNNIVNIDSLIISGIYKITLLNNSEFIGEVIYTDKTTIKFNISDFISTVMKSEIKQIEIPNKYYPEFDDYQFDIRKEDEKKFRNVFFLNASFNLPTGGIKEVYNPGFGIHASVYHMFDHVFGLGPEISYNNFYGSKSQYYYQEVRESDGFSCLKFNANLIAGNFNPGNRFLFYGLLGVGLGYYNEGKTKVNYIDPYNNYNYSHIDEGYSGINFNYGAGAGFSYMLSKLLGINIEIQFNKVSSFNYYYYYDGFNGYFSFKAGLCKIDL